MGASEKRAAAFHPGSGPTGNPWTDEDVARVADLIPLGFTARDPYHNTGEAARAVLDALAPRVAAMVRAGQAEALRDWADDLDRRYPTSRWPELEPEETPLLLDRASASMGRVVARATRRRADEIGRGE